MTVSIPVWVLLAFQPMSSAHTVIYVLREQTNLLACLRLLLRSADRHVLDGGARRTARHQAETAACSSLALGDEHLARLKALEDASGFTRGEILRRLLLTADSPSARTLQEVQDIPGFNASRTG